ncbi:MAG: hypothetical protein WBQ76_10485, partial [Candidatus Korobacteraceae bacterium]
TKPVLAAQPVNPNPEAATPLPEPPKAPETQEPATTGDGQKPGVATKQKPAPVNTAKANLAVAPAALGN